MVSQIAVIHLTLVIHTCLVPNYHGGTGPEKPPPTEPTEDLKIISRKEWDADDPKIPAKTLTIKPIEWVVVSHTATDSCFEQSVCTLLVRKIQSLNMDIKGWGNVGYNFLVGGDGNVYEGLGWELQGARTRGFNHRSLGIALIGNFQDSKPTVEQIEAAKRFLRYARQQGKLSEEYSLIAQRQVAATNSPGRKAYEMIREWPHWTDRHRNSN